MWLLASYVAENSAASAAASLKQKDPGTDERRDRQNSAASAAASLKRLRGRDAARPRQ